MSKLRDWSKLDFRVRRPDKVSVRELVVEEAKEKQVNEEVAKHIEIVSLKEFAKKKKLFFSLQDDYGNNFLLILKAVK